MKALADLPVYFSVEDILAVGSPSLPKERTALSRHAEATGWRDDPRRYQIRPGAGRVGGTIAYHIDLLPADVRTALMSRAVTGLGLAAPAAMPSGIWADYDRLPQGAKDAAIARLDIILTVEQLSAGMTRQEAVALVAREQGLGARTIWRWLDAVADVPRTDRLPALAPRHRGRAATTDCDPRAWDFLVADYLRPEKPAFAACFRRLEEAAEAHGWAPVPAERTLRRRIEKQFPRAAITMARTGRQAAQQIYPHQTRDRSVFAALDAVNADGHMFDVFCKWPDGSIGRPVIVAVQDLYSGMILGWRIDRSESWTMVRLAFLDVLTRWGIPADIYLDNGRAFASKWLSGGMKHRFRFKVKDDEPSGLFKTAGANVHWVTPYHGQAKPIERAWRDLAEQIARSPKCAGAYVGSNPTAKPENYGSRAIPIEVFEGIVRDELLRHVLRPGRNAAACAGRSFYETFRESYEAGLPRRASAEQLRMFLLAADGVTAAKRTGEIQLSGNRYWADALADHAGRKLTVRFDPQDLHAGIAVYTRDGRHITDAPVIEATGFADAEAARRHSADRKRWLKAQSELLAAERRLSIDEVAALMPAPRLPDLLSSPAGNITPLPLRPTTSVGWDDEARAAFGRAIAGLEGDVLPFQQDRQP